MALLHFRTADVFTDRRFQGNPLVVIPDARALDESAMRGIASEFNYSEALFVFPQSILPMMPEYEYLRRMMKYLLPAIPTQALHRLLQRSGSPAFCGGAACAENRSTK